MKLELAKKGIVIGSVKPRKKHVHSKSNHYSRRHSKTRNLTERHLDTEQALIETTEESEDSSHSPMK